MKYPPLLALALLAACASPQPAAREAPAVEPGVVPLTLEQQRQIEEAEG